MSEGPTVARRVVVSGRVQGVFYRDSCRREAERLGVAGWVRNRGDGRVEALFEGSADQVAAMVGWCHHGPDRAVVTDVTVVEATPEGRTGFRTA